VAGAVALVMDDAADLPPHPPPVIGKEAIPSSVQSDLGRFAWQFTEEVVEVDGDLAVMWTNYRVKLVPKAGGEPIEAEGKWIKVLKRQPDGSWKFFRNIWNRDHP
jgi:ketosteroid isomerase-like protein